MKRTVLGLLTLALVAGAVGRVQADLIPSLFNTGVDGSGTPLPDGTIGDPHYELVSVPGGTTDIRVRTAAGGYPIPPYIGDNSSSAWIGPNNDGPDGLYVYDGPVGLYVYRTTFSLTGFDPSTGMITGGWSSDNDGVSILLNGVDTGNPPTSFWQFVIGFAPFSITCGFVPGINTLDFIVNNDAGPTALRVEMTGTAVPVPVPGAVVLAGIGLGFADWRLRRHRAV